MLLRQQKCVSPQRQHLRQLSRIDQQETLRIPDNIDDDDPLNLQPLTKAASIHISFQRMLSLQAQPTYLQVRHSGKWEQWEMDQYKVWEVVPRSPDMRVVGARWVYTRSHAVSTKHLTSGCEVKGLLQLEPIPAFIPDDKAIRS